MAQENVIVQREPEPKPPTSAEITDSQYREYVKSKYGVEDDPDTFKTKYQKMREAEEKLPVYEATLVKVFETIQEQDEQNRRSQLPPQDREEEELVRLASVNPVAGIKKVRELERTAREQDAIKLLYATDQLIAHRMNSRQGTQTSAASLREDWPEAYDKNSELHQLGKYIYQNEMSNSERQSSTGFLAATERAAGRLGIPPRSKRPATTVARDMESIEHQDVRGSKSTRAAKEDDSVALTSREKKMIVNMGLDEKKFKLAKSARAEKRNIRVTE